MKKGTSWNKVADWYDELLEAGEDTYQGAVILPNLMRLAAIREGENVLDVGCGQGLFSRAFRAAGARVIGVDISPRLVEIARERAPEGISFHRGNAERLPMVDTASVDKAIAVLSIQNMSDAGKVFAEVARTLKPNGKLMLVLNHPAFRVPKKSSWGWDEKEKIQYRRVDGYLSESKEKIDMHPGTPGSHLTYSFHRSMQYYMKAFRRNGFAITGLEEWISHRTSQKGPRAWAEDTARKEIPLFMFIEATKISENLP